jgi:hypothetical protein
MQIFRSVDGDFVYPKSEGVTTGQFVSLLQVQAHSIEEAVVLQRIGAVLQNGGTIRVVNETNRLRVDINLDADDPSDAGNVGTETPMTASTEAAEARPELPGPVVESPLPTPEGEHRHKFESSSGSRLDADGYWLRCECGEWKFFRRVQPYKVRKKKVTPTVN